MNYKDFGISNRGNETQIKEVMRKAQEKKELTIGFIGGSITQGSLATKPELSYSSRVFQWWQKTFPQARLRYVNAGIGGTDSYFGVARVESDLLNFKPDMVFVDFSVNDKDNAFFLETYEGLVRKILSNDQKPAMMLVHNVRYDDGSNAQRQHGKVAAHYGVPSVSMKSSIYPLIVNGTLDKSNITQDNLHPNDYGHELVAGVIVQSLIQILNGIGSDDEDFQDPDQIPPMTQNQFENTTRHQNELVPEFVDGFIVDDTRQEGITDVFKRGWLASRMGAKIIFNVASSNLALQYRKSVNKPAPIVQVTIDDLAQSRVFLDGNFFEYWGDCLFLEPVLIHGENRRHKIEIEVIEASKDDRVPFYLAAIIADKQI